MSGNAEVALEVEVQDDAAAMASAMAGYNARGNTPPADVPDEPSAEPEEVPDIVEDEPVSAEKSLAEELAELKAKVSTLASDSDPSAVRKLHGEIGDINRTLQKLQASKPEPEPELAPVSDELTAAMKAAEEAALDFPELAGPIVTALKALNAKQVPVAQAPVVDVAAEIAKQREIDAIEALADDHPDFETVRSTPEFKAWLTTKTPEYQVKLDTTWNPAVVSKGLTEFKESLRVKQKKQDRLAAAVVTPGTQQQARPSTLPDEEGAWVGYNKGKKRP